MNALPDSLEGPTTLQQHLTIRLLGSPILTWNNTNLAIQRRLVRALLYRLACDGEPVARAHLQLLFWPEVPESIARRNLSHLLTHLRQSLPNPQILLTTRDEVWLDSSQMWCDVIEFKHALLDPKLDTATLHNCASLYRGSFLEGFNLPRCSQYEHWCLVERNAFENQYLKVLEQLVERCTTRGEIHQAIKYAQQYLETDSLSEAIHRRLIQLHAASGDRHRALRQFEHCASILKSDLGVDPLPETQAVYEAVLHGQPRFPAPSSPLYRPRLPGKEIPLFGRESELAKLDEAFHLLENQEGRVIFISGEAGIGKSRLMQDFASRHQGEAQVLWGSGYAGEQSIPYQPIIHILRTIMDLQKPGTERNIASFSTNNLSPLEFIEPVWLAEISRLLPEMQVVYPKLPSPLSLEPESARIRLFDALFHSLLAYAVAHGPILLCLDDLQWMDATTKAWLVHIGRYLTSGGCPMLILGAYRSEETQEVLDLRHTLARAGVLSEIRLRGLEAVSILELVRELVGQRGGDEVLARRLHQATGGNPFYIIETVYKLIEDGKLEEHIQESIPFPLPESVCEAVQARLQRLSPVTRQVLEAGAILGQSFGLESLRLTAGRGHAEIMSAIDELIARVVLVETPLEYRFIHEIVRQYIEESLGQVRGHLLHRRAGRAHQILNPDAYPILAHHFELGGDLGKALHYHGLAAQQAQDLFAWQMAELHLGHMLELIGQLDPDCDRPDLVHQRADVLAERANTRYLQDRLADRDADLDALSDLGEASGDDQIRLHAIFNRLRYFNLDGKYPQAILAAEKGLNLLKSSPMLSKDWEQASAARSRLLAQTGFAYYFIGKPIEALSLLEEAWSLCDQKTDPEGCGRILNIQGYVYFHLGDYLRSLECQQKAYAYHNKIGNFNRMVWDLIDIGGLHKDLGDLADAVKFLEEGLELANRVGSQRAKAYGLVHLGDVKMYQGDYASAAAHYQQVLEMQQATHSEYIITSAEAGMGFALYHLGDYAQSRHWLERALGRARATGLRRWIARTLIRLGMLDILEGRLSKACQHLEEGLAVAEDCQAGKCLAIGQAMMARLERLAGNPNHALELAAESVSTARQINLTCQEMWGEIEMGLAYLALGDPSSALEHTGCAASLAPRVGQDWIGCEEVCQVHANILETMSQEEAAEQYQRCAKETIQAKAELIPDPLQRCRFLAAST